MSNGIQTEREDDQGKQESAKAPAKLTWRALYQAFGALAAFDVGSALALVAAAMLLSVTAESEPANPLH